MLSTGQGIVDVIEPLLFQTGVARYLCVASFTVLAYDWIISIDMEIKYIWGAPWSPGRMIYHFNRIWSIIIFCSTWTFYFSPAPSPTRCKAAISFYAYSLIVEFVNIYFVLILRIWALYNNRHMLYALLAGLCASSALSIVFFNVTNDKVIFLDNPTSGVFTDGCLVIHPSTMWMNYLSYVIFDAILFMLTAWRVWVSSREFGSTPLMQRLVENGALHSGVLAVLIVFACAGGTINTLSIPSTAGLIWGMSSVVCSRNIFSLHTLAEEERRQGLSESTSEWLSLGELRVVTPMTELNTTTSASLPSGGSSFRT